MKFSLDLWSVFIGMGVCLSPVILVAVVLGFSTMLETQKAKNAHELQISAMKDPELIKAFLDAFVDKHGEDAVAEDLFLDRTDASEETPS